MEMIETNRAAYESDFLAYGNLFIQKTPLCTHRIDFNRPTLYLLLKSDNLLRHKNMYMCSRGIRKALLYNNGSQLKAPCEQQGSSKN
jgi:hypothetical protein